MQGNKSGTSNEGKSGDVELIGSMDHGIYDGNDEEGSKNKCKICFREFESLCGMESHFEMCKKSLSCGKCKKVLDNVKSFEIHINVCSGESKYRCYVCGKKFNDDVTCSDHIKNCTGKLLCKNYEMKFRHWKMLLEHYKKCHGNIVCNISVRLFDTRSELLEHMEKH